MKIKKETQEKISYRCGIVLAVFTITLSAVMLFMNMDWVNGTFFMFGMMFSMGYALLIVALKRIREEGTNA